MGDILIDEIDEDVIEKLRRRAEGNGRSFEGEIHEILIAASMSVDVETDRNLTGERRVRPSGRPQGDPTSLIREDHDR
jgi:plasmid stability protein